MKIRVIPRTLVILCGIAASGKSTFAKKFFRRTQIVSTDYCRAMISDSAGNQFVSKDAFELFYFIIEKRLVGGRITVADATTLYCPARLALLKIAKRHNARAVLMVFNVSMKVCIKHDKLRRRKVGEEVIHRQYNTLEEALKSIPSEGFDEIYMLDEKSLKNVEVEVVGYVPEASHEKESAS